MQFEDLNTTEDWPENPIPLFREWYQLAAAEGSLERDAMSLATVSKAGTPSVRIVYLRGFDERGFCFFTNYESRKGRELTEHPAAAVAFHWRELYLQVRIEGEVEKQSSEESDVYFNSRPRENRISSLVSNQSRPIDDYRTLRQQADQLLASDHDAIRPEHWGGFRLVPQAIEFWAGSEDRMHRRCEYAKSDDGWKKILLAP